jgi:hypothetical protein
MIVQVRDQAECFKSHKVPRVGERYVLEHVAATMTASVPMPRVSETCTRRTPSVCAQRFVETKYFHRPALDIEIVVWSAMEGLARRRDTDFFWQKCRAWANVVLEYVSAHRLCEHNDSLKRSISIAPRSISRSLFGPLWKGSRDAATLTFSGKSAARGRT